MFGMHSLQDQRTFGQKLNDVAGTALKTATLGLYQPPVGTGGRSGSMEPGNTNGGALAKLGEDAVGIRDFGRTFLPAKLQRQLRKAEEKAITQEIQYIKVKYLGQAAQREMSELGLHSIVRVTSDTDLMNRMVQATETATPEQQEELKSQVLRHIEQSGQAADLAREAIIRKLVEDTMGLPGFNLFD